MLDLNPFPLINTEKKFILFTNAKCGGTVLKSWFLKTLNLENNFSSFFHALTHFRFSFVLGWYLHYYKFIDGTQIINNDKYLRKFIAHHRDATQGVLPDIIDDPSWFKFAVVRNPYDRLVSAFVDKFCREGLDTPKSQKILMAINSTENKGNLQITFSQFVEYLETQNIDTVDRHWRRQSYVMDGIELDRIIDLKEIATALPELEKQFRIKTNFDFDIRRQSNNYDQKKDEGVSFAGDMANTELMRQHVETNTFPKKSTFYNDELKRKVRKIYEDDFKLYPYS